MALCFSACGTEPVQPIQSVAGVQAADIMVGRWEHVRSHRPTGEPSLNAGLIAVIDVDSVADVRFSGRVSLWFAGDVGVPVDAFGPVSGSVADLPRVTLLITMKDPLIPAIEVSGELRTDSISVRGSWRGTEPGPFALGSAFLRAGTKR
ncbi:MAG TPA: hypothetical protein VNL18_08455 [Gemmatimonadales bacterium]|nr:hypothetical protein [Gemmatimonadales bacterium]